MSCSKVDRETMKTVIRKRKVKGRVERGKGCAKGPGAHAEMVRQVGSVQTAE